MAKKNYTSAEKKGYWIGVGATIGLSNGTSSFKSELSSDRMVKSFDEGFRREVSLNPPSAKMTRKLPHAKYVKRKK